MKYLKRYKYLVLAFLILFGGLIVYNSHSQQELYISTTSYIMVKEKQYSKDFKNNWIIADDPNSKEKRDFKIIINNPIIWNLIESDREYFASYHKSGSSEYIIGQLEHINDDNTLRR
jgi:hypothetical protein